MKTLNILTIFILIFLSGCNDNTKVIATNNMEFKLTCLNGVEYYYRAPAYEGVMSVRFDKETKNVRQCSVGIDYISLKIDEKICLDGILYYYQSSAYEGTLSPAYTTDSLLVDCPTH